MNKIRFSYNIAKIFPPLGVSFLVFAAALLSIAHADTNNEISADNSRANRRGNYNQETTAERQGNSKADVEITAKIRQSLMKDENLSTNAHNVKIVTKNGKVTLKGPVKSLDEKATIESKAQMVAGANNVSNEITVVDKG